MKRREAILGELLVGSRPIDTLARELAVFEWDCDKELVTLDRTHAIAMLTDYLAGRRSASEIRSWAETIEGRDDIAVADDCQKVLQEVMFQLANPELGYALSPLLAQKQLRLLRS